MTVYRWSHALATRSPTPGELLDRMTDETRAAMKVIDSALARVGAARNWDDDSIDAADAHSALAVMLAKVGA
jgi:hypothetical protein